MVSVVVRKLEPLSLGSKGTLPAFNTCTMDGGRAEESSVLSGVPHVSSNLQQCVCVRAYVRVCVLTQLFNRMRFFFAH